MSPGFSKYCQKCGEEKPHDGTTMYEGKKICKCENICECGHEDYNHYFGSNIAKEGECLENCKCKEYKPKPKPETCADCGHPGSMHSDGVKYSHTGECVWQVNDEEHDIEKMEFCECKEYKSK